MKFQITNSKQAGFTLIELLIVIAVIAIIASVVFVALNPLQRFQDTRDSQRRQDISAIADAIRIYQIVNAGQVPAGIDENWRMLGTDTTGCNVTCGFSGTPTTVLSRVADGNDDAEEQNPPNGNMYITSTDLELVVEGGTVDQEVGMRFLNMTLPQSDTISNAYIEFTVDETDSGTTNLTFYGEDIDNAPAFTSTDGDITNRSKTSAGVSWNNVPAWTSVGATHQTPSLASIIQEIVNRSGWIGGNAIVIVVDGTGERTAESYNGSPAQAPLLVVEYQSGGAVATQPSCLDLSSTLSSQLSAIGQDPSDGSAARSYYALRRRPAGQIDVIACSPEGGQDISRTK
ncbi:prepilin-type N-terminal cleavage/methylation domain-containing protein [Patescibacteria group bacterium AH-259-L05]|nr:prepilin-type N-terminal cleavage/methylation domain-containing protein [Patescibacteria group bacterium AH-259-L05]